RRNVFRAGAASAVIFPIPFFALVDTGEPWLIYLALILGLALVHASMYGPQAAFFSELFGTQVRYSGASLGYQLGSVVGGLSPLVPWSPMGSTAGSPVSVVAYPGPLSVLAFRVAPFAPDTRHTVTDSQPR